MSGYYPDGCNQATFDRHWSNQLDLPEDLLDDEEAFPKREERAREENAEARESD